MNQNRNYVFAITAAILFTPVPFFLTGCNKSIDFTKNTSPLFNSVGTPVVAITASSKPNIIIILADDVGYEVPTFTGGQSYSTPNLDKLAANGTQFTQVYAAPLCSPSRFMLMTGKYNFRNYTQWGKMDLNQKTLANLAKRAGYTTCVSGKWQLDGGDAAIHNFGFDDYCVSEAYAAGGEESNNDFYKNPTVYQDGNYLPAASTLGKYGPDIFRDYVFNFIDSNKNKPFFIYWAMNLVHKPFSPTPDDSEYATWVSGKKPLDGDSVFFPSMVKYMDKQIGQLIMKLRQLQLDDNTIILFAGDNGTTKTIYSMYNDKRVQGGKSLYVNRGHHVPMLAYGPGNVQSGRKDSSLVDFTDVMATFADLLNTNLPPAYGTIDGVSFYNQLIGLNNPDSRKWVFCHYQPHPDETGDTLHRWIQNRTYKEYDTIGVDDTKAGKFYNIAKDPNEKNPITPRNRTAAENNLYDNFRQTMQSLQ